jgi:hypothetical protein
MTDATIPGVVWIPPEPESFAALKRFAQDFRAERAPPTPPPQVNADRRPPIERRRRKPNVDKLIAKAKAAGATSITVDGVEMRFGEDHPGSAAPTSNPWDAEIARLTQ